MRMSIEKYKNEKLKLFQIAKDGKHEFMMRRKSQQRQTPQNKDISNIIKKRMKEKSEKRVSVINNRCSYLIFLTGETESGS